MENFHRLSTKMLSVFITALLLICLPARAQLPADKDPQLAWSMIESGAVVIDVRTPEEFALDHLENAINIPFEMIIQGVSHYQIDPSAKIMVYCRSGRRSGIAQQTLSQAGYKHAYNGGGLVNLKQYKANSLRNSSH